VRLGRLGRTVGDVESVVLQERRAIFSRVAREHAQGQLVEVVLAQRIERTFLHRGSDRPG